MSQFLIPLISPAVWLLTIWALVFRVRIGMKTGLIEILAVLLATTGLALDVLVAGQVITRGAYGLVAFSAVLASVAIDPFAVTVSTPHLRKVIARQGAAMPMFRELTAIRQQDEFLILLRIQCFTLAVTCFLIATVEFGL